MTPGAVGELEGKVVKGGRGEPPEPEGTGIHMAKAALAGMAERVETEGEVQVAVEGQEDRHSACSSSGPSIQPATAWNSRQRDSEDRVGPAV